MCEIIAHYLLSGARLGILSGILITRGSVFQWSWLHLFKNLSCAGVKYKWFAQ